MVAAAQQACAELLHYRDHFVRCSTTTTLLEDFIALIETHLDTPEVKFFRQFYFMSSSVVASTREGVSLRTVKVNTKGGK